MLWPVPKEEKIGAGEKGFKLDYSFIYFIYFFFIMNAVRLECQTKVSSLC